MKVLVSIILSKLRTIWVVAMSVLSTEIMLTKESLNIRGPVAQIVESAWNVGDLCLIPGLGRSPGGGHGNPLKYSCLENPHGQRSLAGYSP